MAIILDKLAFDLDDLVILLDNILQQKLRSLDFLFTSAFLFKNQYFLRGFVVIQRNKNHTPKATQNPIQ